jgi:hypothetical protein
MPTVFGMDGTDSLKIEHRKLGVGYCRSPSPPGAAVPSIANNKFTNSRQGGAAAPPCRKPIHPDENPYHPLIQ